MSQKIIVFGAGGHAKVIIESLRDESPSAELALVDDSAAAGHAEILGFRVSGDRSWLSSHWPEAPVVPAVGTNRARADLVAWLADAGRSLRSVVDPTARASRSASVEPGCFIAPGAIVNADSSLAAAVIVNTGASVDHDCEIGFASHIAPGAHLCGGVRVGARTLIGAGATVIPGIRIGADVVVAAGAVVTRDVDDGSRVAGVPARPIRTR